MIRAIIKAMVELLVIVASRLQKEKTVMNRLSFCVLFLIFALPVAGHKFSPKSKPYLPLKGAVGPLSPLMTKQKPARLEPSKFIGYTQPPSHPFRAIAEYEPCKGVIIDYDTAFTYVLDSMYIPMLRAFDTTNIAYVVVDDAGVQSIIEQKLTNAGISMGNIEFIQHPTEEYSVWPRDWGPFFIYDSTDKLAAIDALYYDFAPNSDSFPIHFCDLYGLERYAFPLLQEGGDYMTDGKGLVVTTDYFYECNSGHTPHEADSLMKRYFGAERLVVFEVYDSCPGFGHIDIFAKFLDSHTIMISKYIDTTKVGYQVLERCAAIFDTLTTSDGGSFDIVRVPIVLEPGRVGYNTYTNSLILDKQVFLPIYFSSLDDSAISIYSEAMPGYEIISINNHDMVWFAGAGPHCLTKQVPEDSALGIEETEQKLQEVWSACYPNPFISKTTIRYQLGTPGHVTLRIYDSTGRLVHTLIDEDRIGGSYAIEWDGKDISNRKMASGIYFYKLEVGDKFSQTNKLLLLK